MRKRTFGSSFDVTMQDWMLYRPYPAFGTYDGHYLRLANQVFDHLNERTTGLNAHFKRADLKTLAVVLTSHFEDYINQIGIWEALRRKNTECYGRPIPFYNLDNYDAECLNEQDFQYLIWFNCEKLVAKMFHPFSPAILSVGTFCFSFFESKMDKAPTTNFYDKWLTFNEKLPFFDLKVRMQWIGLKNYLLAPSFGKQFEKELAKLNKHPGDFHKMVGEKQIAYILQEDFLWKMVSPFCGMTSPQWLAEVARCTDSVRQQIRRTHQRVLGNFKYVGSDKNHHHFEVIRTGRIFNINKKSMNINVKNTVSTVETGMMTLVFWQDEWWMSGIYIGGDMDQAALTNAQNFTEGTGFYAWSEEHQALLRKQNVEIEHGFIEYFGGRLVIFEDEKKMEAALLNQTKWLSFKKSESEKTYADEGTPKEGFLNLGKLFKKKVSDSIAAFFAPGQGILVSPILPIIIQRMQEKRLEGLDSHELFYSFFTDCDPTLVAELVGQFGIKNLKYPIQPVDSDFVKDNFLLFQHYYNPSGFEEILPIASLMLGVEI